MQIRTSIALLAALAVAAAVALGACGSDDGNDNGSSGSNGSAYGGGSSAKTDKTTTTAAGEKLTLDAVEKGPAEFAFSKPKLSANAGKVTIALTNPSGSQASHAIEVEGNGVEEEGEIVSAGGTSTVSADLKPGTYEFYCPVDSHREEGMEGTLTVR